MRTLPGTFTTSRVARAAGVYPRRMQNWISQGIVRPTVSNEPGSGNWRLFSGEDAICVRVVTILRDLGFGWSDIASVIYELRLRNDLTAPQDDASPLIISSHAPEAWVVLNLAEVSRSTLQRMQAGRGH